MLKTRIITALVLIPILIWLLLVAPNAYLMPVFVICVGLAGWELQWIFMGRFSDARPASVEGSDLLIPILGDWPQRLGRVPYFDSISAAAAAVIGFLLVNLISAEKAMPAFALLFILYGLLQLITSSSMERGVFRAIAAGFLLVYCVFPWSALWRLQGVGDSGAYILFTLVVVFLGDTGGYFGGRFWGRHKLAPLLSPKKTLEGALSGLLLSLVGALFMNWAFSAKFGTMFFVGLVALVGGVLAQLGDLFESGLKRFCGTKDSGGIFPGHGGLLDRVDGVLFAAPWFWFCFLF